MIDYYVVDYGTGEGLESADTLAEAMRIADEGAGYTGHSIIIRDDRGREVARREWYGSPSGREDCDDPISFGQSGYYADWYEV